MDLHAEISQRKKMQKCQNTITAKEIMQLGNDLPSSHYQNQSSN